MGNVHYLTEFKLSKNYSIAVSEREKRQGESGRDLMGKIQLT